MVELPIKRLEYKSAPSYKTVGSYRPYLREVSDYACSYCGITEAESSGATFNIDHFKPQTFFKELKTKCENLRYSCPRCNSYKKDNWISKEQGCIRDCTNCKEKVCKKDIDRFIDVLTENPSNIFELLDDDKLYAYSSSKVANYTIKYLRLNRIQLIRLRHVRRFMDSWEQELKNELTSINNKIVEVNSQLLEFKSSTTDKDNILYNIVITMYELLIKEYEKSKFFIEKELANLLYLKETMRGRDDNSLPI